MSNGEGGTAALNKGLLAHRVETKCHDMGCEVFQNDIEGAKGNFTFQCTKIILMGQLSECGGEALGDCFVSLLPESVVTEFESDIPKLLHSISDIVALPPLNHLAQQLHEFRRDVVGIHVIGKDSTIPHTYITDEVENYLLCPRSVLVLFPVGCDVLKRAHIKRGELPG
jgi:hypothetical protein